MPDFPPRAAVVLLAAGEGRRVGTDSNKVLLPLAGLPVLVWSLRAIERLRAVERLGAIEKPSATQKPSAIIVDQVVVVIREVDRDVIERTLAEHLAGLEVTVVLGGSTRHGSEWNALQHLAEMIDAGSLDVVAIHDAARPLAGTELFSRVIETAARNGGALPTREQRGLVPRDASAAMTRGSRLVGVQTPQAFRAGPLLDAYRAAERDGFVGTDTASCIERYADVEIHCVPTDASNLKITFPEDVALAERLLGTRGPTG